MKTWIISLGGSVVAPETVDVDFIFDLKILLSEYIARTGDKFVLVVGGGAIARAYQQAYRDVTAMFGEDIKTAEQLDALDRIGIQATHLNARFIYEAFSNLVSERIVTDPEDEDIIFDNSILIGAGWKPGFSTDLDAVMLANRFDADTILSLSNIAQMYDADPQKDKNAKPLDSVSWNECIKLVGDTWNPGMNAPFDPVACRLASNLGFKVVIAAGRDLDNLSDILDGKDFIGTMISH